MAQVKLRPTGEDEYRSWYEEAVAEYAQDHAATGYLTPDEAREMAAKEFQGLLPEGLNSKGQHLHTIADAETGACVGMIWFAERGAPQVPHAFIYDVVVWERHRGKGYGKAAMLAVEQEVQALGLRRIALHVFGENPSAIGLYERTGYRTTNRLMAWDEMPREGWA